MRVARGAALGPGTAKAAATRGGGFGSFLDGCLAGDGGRGESTRQSQSPGEKSQDGGGASHGKPPVSGNGFAFPDGCLAKDGGLHESHATELPPIPGGKSQADALAAPAAVSVPAAATLLLRLALGLEPWGTPGDSAAQDPETDA